MILKDNSKIGIWVLQSTAKKYNTLKLVEFDAPQKNFKLETGLEVFTEKEIYAIDDFDKQPPPIKIKNPAITVIQFESSAVTYYWTGNKFKSVYNGD